MEDAPKGWRNLAEKQALEAVPIEERWPAETVYALMRKTAAEHPMRPAVSFQIKSGPNDPAETLEWTALAAQVTRAANLFRRLGIHEGDVIAYLLPNCNETVMTLLGGLTAGIVNPINPLLETAQIASILRETKAKILVTLAPFPKTDVAQKAHAAVAEAPNVETILEVDLKRYLKPPLSWLIPLLRPKIRSKNKARVRNFNIELGTEKGTALAFQEAGGDRVAAYFHTGGTTGMPKIAQHTQRGMVYNGLIPSLAIIGNTDVMICPLPLFHVFGAYPVLMACVATGAHFVMPTPAGYRGEGVMDNFWALVERWGVTFLIMVPTAASALMQRPVKADVSSLKFAISGSAPLPAELFKRFEAATGMRILEGYGMTEATCLISINPTRGERKIGSVGLPIPYTEVKILDCETDGTTRRECATDEIGEICIASPAVFPGYTDPARNHDLFAEPGHFLRSGDLGRIDEDGYVWITGRAKDMIIRGGHNIDPALIEEALAGHEAVAFAGAIGQPDAHSGELPCAYVELADGAQVTVVDLMAFAAKTVPEHAAVPKYIEIMDELPKTAVGKVFKPALRKLAIARIYGAALTAAKIDAELEVAEHKTRGLVVKVKPKDGSDEAKIGAALNCFARPWEISG